MQRLENHNILALNMREHIKNEDETVLIAASEVVTELNGYDVLLGRSVPKWKCSGNGIFRNLIARHGDEYRSLNKHVYKDEIARRILLTIRALRGRFLRQIELSSVKERLNIDSDTEAWVVVDEETSLQKIKQALRDLPYNAKSPSASTVVRENFGAAPKLITTEERISADCYLPFIPSAEMFESLRIRNISRLPIRNRHTTKLEELLAHRKSEYMRVHNLAISTQLRLLKQHQRQRMDPVRIRRHTAPFRDDSPKLTLSSVKKVYVR